MREEWDHDAAGRVIAKRILQQGVLESSVAYTYQLGQLITSLDSVHGAPEAIAYDASGRPERVTHPGGETERMSYDARSRVVSREFVDAAIGFQESIGLEYDLADREVAIRRAGADLLRRTIHDGSLSEIRYGNGLARSFHHDPLTGVATSITASDPQGQAAEVTSHSTTSYLGLVHSHEVTTATSGGVDQTTQEDSYLSDGLLFSPHRSGSRLQIVEMAPNANWRRDYLYDGVSNLTEQVEIDPQAGCQGSATRILALVYNAERNRLQRIDQDSCPALIHSYAYDEAGFVIDRDGVAIDWDGAGRVRSVGSMLQMTWDSVGRPVRRTLNGTTVHYRFGGVIEGNAAGLPLALDLGEVRVDLPGTSDLYRHLDYRGNVKVLTDSGGTVVSHYEYSGYELTAVHGSDTDREARFAQGLDLGGLMLLGHRLYDPAAARFLAPDPIYQLLNQYAYTLGNPVDYWDPTGASASALGRAFTFSGAAIGGYVVAAILVPPAGVPTLLVGAAGGVIGTVYAAAIFNAVSTFGNPGGARYGLGDLAPGAAPGLGGGALSGAGAGFSLGGAGLAGLGFGGLDVQGPAGSSRTSGRRQLKSVTIEAISPEFEVEGALRGLSSLSFAIAIGLSGFGGF
jgi:RHS repeat-associated protein